MVGKLYDVVLMWSTVQKQFAEQVSNFFVLKNCLEESTNVGYTFLICWCLFSIKSHANCYEVMADCGSSHVACKAGTAPRELI